MLTVESIAERRANRTVADRVIFGVRALYGISQGSVALPLSAEESIDSGQICVTIDPEADQFGNVGLIDYTQRKLTVRYAVQAVFPGLYDLVRNGGHDPSLLYPVRIVATDECDLTTDYAGWRAFGCLDFLPGSIWAGATGG